MDVQASRAGEKGRRVGQARRAGEQGRREGQACRAGEKSGRALRSVGELSGCIVECTMHYGKELLSTPAKRR